MSDPLLLLADLGGTNTRVALARGLSLVPDSIARYANDDHAGIGAVLTRHMNATGARPAALCVAMAGPVENGIGTLTNRDWVVSAAELARETGIDRVLVLNDLQAQGHALAHLGPSQVHEIAAGTDALASGTRMVLGCGTGVNAAVAVPTPAGMSVPPSESGHISLPAHSPRDRRIAESLAARHGIASVEEALSGRGMLAVYRILAGREAPSHEAILQGARDGSDPDAVACIETYCSLLGAVCGDLALVHLPVSGLYLIGGVARAVTPFLNDGPFLAAFRNKGRFSEFMARFPLSTITDDYAALIGCASALRNQSSA